MISTTSLITRVSEVPREWVFEHYLKLSEKLTGQEINMRSPFKPDRNPSMYIYYSTQYSCYLFKDFSSGKYGSCMQLVQHLFNLPSKEAACSKIIKDYNEYLSNGGAKRTIEKIKTQKKFKASSYETRDWINLDKNYWSRYYIGSKLLEHYCVKPLDYFVLSKEEDDGLIHETTIRDYYIYGYFRKDGTLYKIYKPYIVENKFLKVQPYIQGTDQLTFDKPYLVICSSLKDIMAFTRLGYNNAEAVAPDSENCLIPMHIMALYKSKYKAICTLFDNDPAGKEGMSKYENVYGIPGVLLEMSKDLSDSCKDYGINRVRETVTPLLKKALNT